MTRRGMPVRERPFSDIEDEFTVVSNMSVHGAVERLADGHYLVSVRLGLRLQAGELRPAFDAFHLAPDGLVLMAPRGYAKDWRPVRITGLDEAVAKYPPASTL